MLINFYVRTFDVSLDDGFHPQPLGTSIASIIIKRIIIAIEMMEIYNRYNMNNSHLFVNNLKVK